MALHSNEMRNFYLLHFEHRDLKRKLSLNTSWNGFSSNQQVRSFSRNWFEIKFLVSARTDQEIDSIDLIEAKYKLKHYVK